MISFTPNDRKAIKWWFKTNPQFKPAMTVYPLVSWEVRGKRVEKHIEHIRRRWENRNAKPEKARA